MCCSLEDLELDAFVDGTVKNVCPFGAFVDVGVGTDGLLHSSEYRFLNITVEKLLPGARLRLKIGEVDTERKRISLRAIRDGAQALHVQPERRSEHSKVERRHKHQSEPKRRHEHHSRGSNHGHSKPKRKHEHQSRVEDVACGSKRQRFR